MEGLAAVVGAAHDAAVAAEDDHHVRRDGLQAPEVERSARREAGPRRAAVVGAQGGAVVADRVPATRDEVHRADRVALYRMGEYEAAVEKLEKAIELVPEDPTINDHLGDAYWRIGRLIEARYQWRRALQFGPQEDEIKPIEAKIEHGLNAADAPPKGG